MDFKICSRCILDTTALDIWFDGKGVCKYCYIHDEMEKEQKIVNHSNEHFDSLIEKIKKTGRKNKHDCIVGVSGGRDSTYTLYLAVKLGLRPLAVHFDTGWNSDISVKNIKNACEKLNVDLHTIVADWEEFKDLQIAFLKSSTPDADIPADYGIYSVLYYVANKENIKYIFNGHSFRTEGSSPISWTYMDPLYVRNVHKKYGKIKKFRSFPHMTLSNLLYYLIVKRITEVRLLELIDYKKKEIDSFLEKELNWMYYGGHHHENLFTRFFQSYYLPTKFNIDKRKTELSALIRSGQISREDALTEITRHPYQYDEKNVEYVVNKLGLTKEEFDIILRAPVKSHDDYRTFLPLIRFLKEPIRLFTKLRLLPYILYLKYAS
jgi:N-acetyl sugar amidotransferase